MRCWLPLNCLDDFALFMNKIILRKVFIVKSPPEGYPKNIKNYTRHLLCTWEENLSRNQKKSTTNKQIYQEIYYRLTNIYNSLWNWEIPQSLAIVSPLLTWKIKLALSLSVVSSGESTGICFVNLMSNWETSSSLRCWGQNQWNWLAWLFQVETTLRTHKQWFDWWFKTTCQYIVPVDMLEERMRLHCHRIIWSATQTLWLLSLHQASHQISGFGCEVCWQIKFSF